MNTGRPGIETLEGEELNGVAFVMDYVELHFNGPVLRCLAPPTVAGAKGSYTFPLAGSRDALCALIGATVSSVEIAEGRHIRVTFNEARAVTIPLAPEARIGPEAATFQMAPFNAPLDVFGD